MKGSTPGGPLGRFRRLTEITFAATFALVVVGGIVRVSDSGLGCGPGGSGAEGWPLCNGSVLPLLGNVNEIIEFSHRTLAGIVVVMIGLMAWRAYRELDSHRWAFHASMAAGVLVLVQAGLGGLTVERALEEELVAAHLGLAMLLLGLLLWTALRARGHEPEQPGHARAAPVPGLKPFAAVTCVLVLAAIVAGGYIAGTEKHGTVDQPVGGAHLACGEQFPGCANQGVLPFGESRLIDIQLAHRALVYGATAAMLALLAAAYRRGSRSRLLAVSGGLLAAQFALGVINVLTGKHVGLVLAHLTLGTIVWIAALLIAFRLAWAVARVPEADAAAPARRAAAAA